MSSKNWIQTFTGKQFRPLEPDPGTICIEDIAHALSNCCRYTGHVKRFYSVAEHSVRVSRRVYEVTGDLKQSLWGLLHDASEAYIADIARPLKQQPEYAAYRSAERRLQIEIAHRFGLDPVEPDSVKRADVELLGLEASQLMAPIHPEWAATAPPGAFPVSDEVANANGNLGWQPRDAETWFLRRFSLLTTALDTLTKARLLERVR